MRIRATQTLQILVLLEKQVMDMPFGPHVWQGFGEEINNSNVSYSMRNSVSSPPRPHVFVSGLEREIYSRINSLESSGV